MVIHFIFIAALFKTWQYLYFLKKVKELADVLQPGIVIYGLDIKDDSANQPLNLV